MVQGKLRGVSAPRGRGDGDRHAHLRRTAARSSGCSPQCTCRIGRSRKWGDRAASSRRYLGCRGWFQLRWREGEVRGSRGPGHARQGCGCLGRGWGQHHSWQLHETWVLCASQHGPGARGKGQAWASEKGQGQPATRPLWDTLWPRWHPGGVDEMLPIPTGSLPWDHALTLLDALVVHLHVHHQRGAVAQHCHLRPILLVAGAHPLGGLVSPPQFVAWEEKAGICSSFPHPLPP